MTALHQNVANCQNTQMRMTDAGTTKDNFILPAGGLPISQDWLDRMKLVRNRTIPIIIGYTNLGMPNANMPGYPTKNNVVFWQHFKTHFRITIPIKGCSSFIDCKAWKKGRKEMFYLMTHSTHFIDGYMVSDIS